MFAVISIVINDKKTLTMEPRNFPINHKFPTYDPESVQPMRDELKAVGFKELLTVNQIDETLDKHDNKTVLVVLNSVCGCAAGSARPGVMLALQNKIIPDEIATVFAGMEKEAVEHYRRKYLAHHKPSSPNIALFKNGGVISIFNRSDIEGHSAEEIANALVHIFEKECSREGPSVNAEEYGKASGVDFGCCSDLPKFKK